MAEIIEGQIFRSGHPIGKTNEYGIVFMNYSSKYLLTERTFNLISTVSKDLTHFLYRIEGVESNVKKNIKILYKGQNYFYDELNEIDLNLFTDLENYKIYIDDVLIKNPIQSGEYGVITGNVSVTECNVNDADNLVIRCFRNDDYRYIGEYPINNGTYSIPNLDANVRYDLILVDKDRGIEQQVLSYRLPIKY